MRNVLFENEDRFGGQIEHVIESDEVGMLMRQLEDAQFIQSVLDVTLLHYFRSVELIGRVFLHAFLHRRKATTG